MSEPDIDLRFVYDGNTDARNFRVCQVIENAPERLEVYRARLSRWQCLLKSLTWCVPHSSSTIRRRVALRPQQPTRGRTLLCSSGRSPGELSGQRLRVGQSGSVSTRLVGEYVAKFPNLKIPCKVPIKDLRKIKNGTSQYVVSMPVCWPSVKNPLDRGGSKFRGTSTNGRLQVMVRTCL